jgi:hypothetical protein
MISPALAPPDRPADDVARVLFEEARQRRRRIRLAGCTAVVVLSLTATMLGLTWSRHPQAPGAAEPGAATLIGAAGAARSAQVVWVDWDGRAHLGNLSTLTQHVVAEIDADGGTPLVQAAGRVYWVDQGGRYMQGAFWPTTIEELNLASGRSRDVGPGEFVFPSADQRHLYISKTDTSLAELPIGGSGRSRQLTLPPGWYLPGGFSVAVADGILVQSTDDQAIRHPPALAVWNQDSGQVKILGRSVGAFMGAGLGGGVGDVIGAYTPPGAGYSLLAWMPASCRFPVSCPIRITNTSTLSSRTLRSPLPYGFALGGAFSPDGRLLAVFVNRSPGTGGGTAELAIVSTRTGALRLVPGTRLALGEDLAWARWLPGTKQLIAEGAHRDYLVAAATFSVRPLSFASNGGQDPNYSAAIVPPRR